MSVRPEIIAHRGASGYLPEHTLVAKALAVGMGADYLEQDVVATGDGQLIVFHDLTLEATTDVARRFPGRARADGSFYCMDFALDELRQLTAGERRAAGSSTPRFAGRFPDGAGRFPIVTLEEELAFVAGLGRSTGRRIGIYPEIKEPAWHRRQGVDLGAALLRTLERFGYTEASDPVYVQCFDPAELKRLRVEKGCRLRFAQLIDRDTAVDRQALEIIATYAEAIGPALDLVYLGREEGAHPRHRLSSLVRDAHSVGLIVHPFTFRRDQLPAGMTDFDELLDLVLVSLGADGLFTDFPDVVSRFIARRFPAAG